MANYVFDDLPDGFPNTEELEEQTVLALEKLGGQGTTTEIKNQIVKNMKLSDEVLEYENSDGLTTLIDYRMRWARTSLKNKNVIENPTRGMWKLK